MPSGRKTQGVKRAHIGATDYGHEGDQREQTGMKRPQLLVRNPMQITKKVINMLSFLHMGFHLRIIDAHVHLDRVPGEDLERMAMCGVEGCVIPTPHVVLGVLEPEDLCDIIRRLLDFEVPRGRHFGIEAFVAVSVPFYGVVKADQCLRKITKYLENERVVAIGEIGMDAGSEEEERLFRAHLRMAKDYDKPVIIHTPVPGDPRKVEVTKKIIEIAKQEGFDLRNAVLDHTGFESLDMCLNSGAMVGLSVCYDKLTPQDAAEIVKKYDGERLIINSEFGFGKGGYFSVPRVVLEMRKKNIDPKTIERIVFTNPKTLFRLQI
jgi:predicted metal-dependent TIM-barrel fold hydrolase